MISSIINGIEAIINFLETIFNFLVDVVKSGIKLISSIPDIFNMLSSAIGLLPTMLLSAALFCISVRVAVLVINKKAGE